MKKSYGFLILILLGCLHQSLVNGATIQPIERSIGKLNISIDPRMEILTTVQLLSNYPVIRRNLPYSKDILNYFESFSSHEAVVMTDSLLQEYGFSYDAPVYFMLHLSQLPELEHQIAFPDLLKGRSGGDDNLEQYRKSIKQFAEISDFESFWNSKIPFYNQILDLTIAEMGEMDMVKDLEDYLNETYGSYNIVIAPSFRGGYGPKVPDANGEDIIYACIQTTNIQNGIPYVNRENLLFYVWHEFSHSFVNPATDRFSERVESLDKLFEPIKENMSKIAYRYWKTCVYEHIVRAVNIRLFELHLGAKYSNFYLKNELRRGFIYIEPLIEKLKDFENQRDENHIAFSEFYPELLNELDEQIPKKPYFLPILTLFGSFWLFVLLVVCVLAFNICVIVQIKRSDLKKKWLKYIAVILLNVPTIKYGIVNGLSFKMLDFQLLLGIGFDIDDILNSFLAFGIPLGGLYWFWKLKTRKNEVIEPKL